MEVKPIKKSVNKYWVYASVLLTLTAFYLYADYYSWLPKQVVSGEGVSGEIIDSYVRNKLYTYLGNFANLFFFTVQTFYFLVVILAVYGFNKSEKVKLWINFGKVYATLVAILFMITIFPTIPMTQLPYTFAIETTMHLLVPGLYLWFTKDIKFKKVNGSLKLFMIIPLTHYLFNWVLHLGSGLRAWTYPFFNFTNPIMMNWSIWFRIVFDVMVFGLLVSVFMITWTMYEKKKATK